FVRVNHPLFDEAISDLVWPRASRSSDQIPCRLHRSVAAAVKNKIQMVRHDSPVLFHASFHFDDRRMARIAGHYLFRIVHDHLYRLAALERQKVASGNIHESALAPEISANMDWMKSQFLFDNPEAIRKLSPDRKRCLAA